MQYKSNNLTIKPPVALDTMEAAEKPPIDNDTREAADKNCVMPVLSNTQVPRVL